MVSFLPKNIDFKLINESKSAIVSEHPLYRRVILNASRAFLSGGAAHFHSKTEKVCDSRHSRIERREVRFFVVSISELSFCFSLTRIITGEHCCLYKVARVNHGFNRSYNCRENKKRENNSRSPMCSRVQCIFSPRTGDNYINREK